jgi:hypothetical protein
MSKGRSKGAVWILLRFALAAAFLSYVASAYQSPLVDRVVPLFRIWFDAFDDTYSTMDLRVVRMNGEDVIQRTATPKRIHVVGGKVVWKGSRLQNEAGAGLILQPLVLGLALVVAWPWQRWPELGLRAVIVTPLLLAVVLFDLPPILYGLEWYEELRLLDPDQFSLLVQWGDMMNSGGRFGLTAVAAVLAVVGASRLQRGDARQRSIQAAETTSANFLASANQP